jgi:hypothetical protein
MKYKYKPGAIVIVNNEFPALKGMKGFIIKGRITFGKVCYLIGNDKDPEFGILMHQEEIDLYEP